MKGAPSWMCVSVRVAVECPECASPIPVNGVVPNVLCHACQSVVPLAGALSWEALASYAKGEGVPELDVAVTRQAMKMLDAFLALDAGPRHLRRRHFGCSIELDEAPPRCSGCRAEVEGASLLELLGAASPQAFCPTCGESLSFRLAGDAERSMHAAVAAVVSETALRGDLKEHGDEAVLFSCMGCGGPLKIGVDAPRVPICNFCQAANYLPDALWLRLHPAQRKRPFYFLLRADLSTMNEAKNVVRAARSVSIT